MRKSGNSLDAFSLLPRARLERSDAELNGRGA
jgi:hypothetical protein